MLKDGFSIVRRLTVLEVKRMTKGSTGGLLVFLTSAASLGCSGGGSVNIGNTQTRGSQLSDYAATWDGYAQAYSYMPDGSDRVRLVIAADGQGTLRLGDAALLAPPTDPNVGFPPGLNPGSPDLGYSMGILEGFMYPLHAARVQTDRIQLGVDPADLWVTWCALQTPVPMSDQTAADGGALSYGCLPNLGFSEMANVCALTEPDGTSVPVDCGKLTLCRVVMACACTAAACNSASVPDGTPVNQYQVEIDGALDATGSTLTGTLQLSSSTRLTVILQKQ